MRKINKISIRYLILWNSLLQIKILRLIGIYGDINEGHIFQDAIIYYLFKQLYDFIMHNNITQEKFLISYIFQCVYIEVY